ncbi:MAG: NAD-dependent epimerase/dehydratase family protein [Candidatus Syntrophopropionicum ammoniitolerans]
MFGSGEQTRDFVYVKDVASAGMAALHRRDGGVFNISTGEGVSVNRLFQKLLEVTGSRL